MKNINLLPKRYEITFKQKKGIFYIAGLAILAIAMIFLYVRIAEKEILQLQIEQDDIQKQLIVLQSGVIEDAQLVKKLQLQQVVKLLQLNKIDWFSILSTLIDSLPPETQLFQLSFDEQDGKLKMSGQVSSFERFQQYIDYLRGTKQRYSDTKMFKNVKVTNVTTNQADNSTQRETYEFTIEMTLKLTREIDAVPVKEGQSGG
jgi:Tfp pilus assembly protein PilN